MNEISAAAGAVSEALIRHVRVMESTPDDAPVAVRAGIELHDACLRYAEAVASATGWGSPFVELGEDEEVDGVENLESVEDRLLTVRITLEFGIRDPAILPVQAASLGLPASAPAATILAEAHARQWVPWSDAGPGFEAVGAKWLVD